MAQLDLLAIRASHVHALRPRIGDPSLVIGSFRMVRSSRNGPSVHDLRASVMKPVGASHGL
jgi:hypothetical protein